MSIAGFWVGIGDAAGEHNRRTEQSTARDREQFAESLRRVAESADWPEQARVKAAELRARLFSDSKIKRKDYEKLWAEVHEASARPGVPSAELAAAKSDVPAMQSLQEKLRTPNGVPAAQPDGLTMGRPGASGGAFDLLRPTGEQFPGAAGLLGLRPAGSSEPNLVSPMSMSQAAARRGQQAADVVRRVPEPPPVYGPITRAEQSQQEMERLKTLQSGQLDIYRQQKSIDAEFAKPTTEWDWDSKRGIFVNKQSPGFYAPPGLPEIADESGGTGGPPEQQFIMAHLGALKAQGINVADPMVRAPILDKLREKWTALGRDPLELQKFIMNFEAQQEFRQYRAQMDTRQAAGVIDTKYQKAKETAYESVRMANRLVEEMENASLSGDLAGIYSAMRALDPSSVVREQEYRVGQGLGGPWHAFVGRMNQLLGEGILDDPVRQEFRQMGQRLIRQANDDLRDINGYYQSMADSWNVPQSMIPFTGESSYVPGTTPPAVGGLNRVTPQNVSANGAWFTPSGPPHNTTAPASPGANSPFVQGLINALNAAPTPPPKGNRP